jgi:hypothetical protein
MVFGLCQFIAYDGTCLATSQPTVSENDYYRALLRTCPIWHPAAAICRREVFEAGITFDESLVVCSDYDLYLRIARRWPIDCHNKVVSQYRQHEQQKTSNKALMLEHVCKILRAQRPFISKNEAYKQAFRTGMDNWRALYSNDSITQLWANVCAGKGKLALHDLLVLLKYDPFALSKRMVGSSR